MRHRWAAVGGAYRWSTVYKNDVFYLLSGIMGSLFPQQTDLWTDLTGGASRSGCCRASAIGRQPDRARLFLSPKINRSLITGGAAGCRAGQVTQKMLTAARPANLIWWWWWGGKLKSQLERYRAKSEQTASTQEKRRLEGGQAAREASTGYMVHKLVSNHPCPFLINQKSDGGWFIPLSPLRRAESLQTQLIESRTWRQHQSCPIKYASDCTIDVGQRRRRRRVCGETPKPRPFLAL